MKPDYEYNHINKDILQDLNQDRLENDTYFKVLEHITQCEQCASLYADSLIPDLLPTPPNFKEEVMCKTQTANKKNQSGKIQLITYSLKVGVAMAAAILLVFSTTALTPTQLSHIGSPKINFGITAGINSSLRNFSDKLIQMEVINYDKKEK